MKSETFRLSQTLNQVIKEKDWLKLEIDALNDKIEENNLKKQLKFGINNLSMDNWSKDEMIRSLMNEQEEVCLQIKDNEYLKKE